MLASLLYHFPGNAHFQLYQSYNFLHAPLCTAGVEMTGSFGGIAPGTFQVTGFTTNAMRILTDFGSTECAADYTVSGCMCRYIVHVPTASWLGLHAGAL